MQNALLDLSAYTVHLASETDFAGWREAARNLALNDVAPHDVAWLVGAAGETTDKLPTARAGNQFKVSRDFVERAETVVCHSDPERFTLLYRMLWRMRSEPTLLKIASDPDVRRFEALEKAVRRDIHKMRAFVRFRKLGDGEDECYVAWFEPEH